MLLNANLKITQTYVSLCFEFIFMESLRTTSNCCHNFPFSSVTVVSKENILRKVFDSPVYSNL